MSNFQARASKLINQLTEAELASVWGVLENLYLDLYALRAVEDAQQAVNPGDALNREEALIFLSMD